MVSPSSIASRRITSSTSLTSSGSSADVGSSSSSTLGLGAIARAIATRCCWPPERWRGSASARGRRPTRSSSSFARRSASVRAQPCTQRKGPAMFSRAVRWPNRLNCWNTMPTPSSARSLASARGDSRLPSSAKPRRRPPTLIVPASQPSRWLIQRSSVLLPEPDGPSSAITSPNRTVSATPSSTACLS